MNKLVLVFLLLITCTEATSQNKTEHQLYSSENLIVNKLSPNLYLHISYYGKYECNGLIYVNNDEALVIDTPTNNATSAELLDWIESALNNEVTAVVITHFHDDCLGGLQEFHKRGVASYANATTTDLASAKSKELPKNSFESSLELKVGKETVVNRFIGEGHTVDNIVTYIPEEKTLFGGCLIKSMGAGKGNLEDANIKEWSNTVEKIKAAYPNLKLVIPGHGEPGGINLLDYTAEMFEYGRD